MLFWLFLTLPALLLAQERPQITEITQEYDESKDLLNSNTKEALLNYLAEIYALYPEEELYFLARDMESLYDIAQLVSKPEDLERLHKIDVSRDATQSPLLLEYLEQFHLEKGRGKNSKRVLLDICCFGNVITDIRTRLEDRELRGHMISVDGKYPNSRLFAATVKEELSENNNRTLPLSVSNDLEDLPHFDSSGLGYERKEETVVPVRSSDASPSERQKRSLQLMAELKDYFDNEAMRESFQNRVRLMREFVEELKKGSSASVEKLYSMKKSLEWEGLGEFVPDLEYALSYHDVQALNPRRTRSLLRKMRAHERKGKQAEFFGKLIEACKKIVSF